MEAFCSWWPVSHLRTSHSNGQQTNSSLVYTGKCYYGSEDSRFDSSCLDPYKNSNMLRYTIHSLEAAVFTYRPATTYTTLLAFIIAQPIEIPQQKYFNMFWQFNTIQINAVSIKDVVLFIYVLGAKHWGCWDPVVIFRILFNDFPARRICLNCVQIGQTVSAVLFNILLKLVQLFYFDKCLIKLYLTIWPCI